MASTSTTPLRLRVGGEKSPPEHANATVLPEGETATASQSAKPVNVKLNVVVSVVVSMPTTRASPAASKPTSKRSRVTQAVEPLRSRWPGCGS